jgi:hypothetical protein
MCPDPIGETGIGIGALAKATCPARSVGLREQNHHQLGALPVA